MSSIGNNNNNNDSDDAFQDWLDPSKKPESENLKRVREILSEESLPINFDTTTSSTDTDTDENGTRDDVTAADTNDTFTESKPTDESINIMDANNLDDDDDDVMKPKIDQQNNSNSNSNSNSGDLTLTNESDTILNNNTSSSNILASNPYLQVVSKLSPSQLISKFTSTAHPRVQDAVRNTVLGLIGSLPKMTFETTTITTGERLASLMFQLQMTGYMLKNADYRLSLSQSLGTSSVSTSKSGTDGNFLLKGTSTDTAADDEYDINYDIDDDDDDDDENERLSQGKVKGKIKISYDKQQSSIQQHDESDDTDDDDAMKKEVAMEMEVDAAAYMAELRNEVSKLREELTTTRKAKEEDIRKDLLMYIRTLPKQELQGLTNTLSDDVLSAMKGLVNVVMAGVGEGQIGPDTVTEQSGEAMAQLCMWQLVAGYNLRELEVGEEMKNALTSSSSLSSSSSSSYNENDSIENSNREDDDDNDDDDDDGVVMNQGGFE